MTRLIRYCLLFILWLPLVVDTAPTALTPSDAVVEKTESSSLLD